MQQAKYGDKPCTAADLLMAAAKQGKKFLADLASDSEDSGAENVGAAPRSAEGEDADETGKTPEARMAAARANVAELFGKKKEG